MRTFQSCLYEIIESCRNFRELALGHKKVALEIVCSETSVIHILSSTRCIEYDPYGQRFALYWGKEKLNRSKLGSVFLKSFRRFPERPALEFDNDICLYQQTYAGEAALAVTLQLQQPKTDPNLTAILAHRSASAFVAILGTLLRSHGYVPISPDVPT